MALTSELHCFLIFICFHGNPLKCSSKTNCSAFKKYVPCYGAIFAPELTWRLDENKRIVAISGKQKANVRNTESITCQEAGRIWSKDRFKMVQKNGCVKFVGRGSNCVCSSLKPFGDPAVLICTGFSGEFVKQ